MKWTYCNVTDAFWFYDEIYYYKISVLWLFFFFPPLNTDCINSGNYSPTGTKPFDLKSVSIFWPIEYTFFIMFKLCFINIRHEGNNCIIPTLIVLYLILFHALLHHTCNKVTANCIICFISCILRPHSASCEMSWHSSVENELRILKSVCDRLTLHYSTLSQSAMTYSHIIPLWNNVLWT